MRLSEVKVDGFGILNNLYLSKKDLAKNITVIHGLNETGKSTLIEFIRAVLFGSKLLEPVRGGRAGGFLVFTDEEGKDYRIERYLRGKKFKASVILPDGTVGDDSLLKSKILSNVSPLVFRNVFALGMDDLRRLEELRSGEVGAYVYGAGAGIRAGRLAAGLSRLQKELSELFKPGGSKPEVNRLLRELEETEATVRRLGKGPERYGEMRREVAALRERRASLEERKKGMEQRRRRLDRAHKARESWICLLEARCRLAGLPCISSFPVSGSERLQALEDRRNELEADLKEMAPKLSGLEGRLNLIAVDTTLLERSPEIKALDGERLLHLERLRRLPELSGETRGARVEYEKQLQKLGGSFDDALVEAFDTSLPAREAAQEYNLKFTRCEARLQELQAAVTGAEKRAGEKESDLCSLERELAEHQAPLPPTGYPLAERERALDFLDAGSRRLAAFKSRLEQLRDKLSELKRNLADTGKESGNAPVRLFPWWLTVALVLAVAAFTAAVFFAGVAQGAAAFVTGCAVLAAALLAGRRAGKADKERRRGLEEIMGGLKQRIGEAAVELEQLSGKEAALTGEIKKAALTALGRPDFTEEDIPAARRALEEERRALARAEDLERAVIKAKEALNREYGSLSGCQADLDRAEAAVSRLRKEWRAWLELRGLPPDLLPAAALSCFDAVEEARRCRDAWLKAAGREKETRRQGEAFTTGLNALLAALGRAPATGQGDRYLVPPQGETACSAVITLTEALERAVKLAGEKKQLEAELQEKRGQKQVWEAAINDLNKEIKRLLAEGGAEEPGEFHRRAVIFGERKKIKDEIRACERDLNIIAGSQRALEDLKKDLAETGKVEDEEEPAALTAQIADLEKDIKEAGEQIGRLEGQMRTMESGEELAVMLQEKEMKLAGLQRKAREWQVRALCLGLLNMAKERHERRRQPAVLRQASCYIGPMTSGVYEKVIAPVGRADALEVETPDRTRVAAGSLSRGAASQLYLAVRLALARQFQGTGLPVLLDDILVDFDPDRLNGAVQVLGEFGRDRQIILLTCHDHILAALDETLEDFSLIHLEVEKGTGSLLACPLERALPN